MLLYEWASRASKNDGAEKALVYRDTYVSWRGLMHRLDRRAIELSALGLGKGDWIGVMLGNIPEFVILALAVAKLEAVVVPLDPTLGTRELDLILSAIPLRGLITRPRGGESAAAGDLDEKKIHRRISPQARRRLQGTLLSCATYAPQPQPKTTADAEVVLVTTDSAGDAKGVLRSRQEMLALCQLAKKTLALSAKDRVLSAEPLFQAYGFDLGFAIPFCFGATLYLEDELSEKRILKIMREHQATFVPGSTMVYQPLCREPKAHLLRTKGARFLCAGTQDNDMAQAFHKRYGIRLAGCYHTTEAGPVAVDLGGQHIGSVGKPFSGVEFRVGDGEVGKVGPIWVRSPGLTREMIGARPEASGKGQTPVGAVGKEGWLRTGDLGRTDKTGHLFLCGREDDMVGVEGRRVALGEVEACIESIAHVAAAQVAVEKDALGGSFVVARVVPKGRIAAEEIINHCAKNLAPHKVPRRVDFCQQLEPASTTPQ